jgi:hypothetical protein
MADQAQTGTQFPPVPEEWADDALVVDLVAKAMFCVVQPNLASFWDAGRLHMRFGLYWVPGW